MVSDYKRIVNILRTFEKALDKNQVIGINFANFCNTSFYPLLCTMRDGDNFIVFELLGDNNDSFAVVQHCSQINFQIKALQKQENTITKRGIGFRSNDDLQEENLFLNS